MNQPSRPLPLLFDRSDTLELAGIPIKASSTDRQIYRNTMLYQKLYYAVVFSTLSWLQLSSGSPIENIGDEVLQGEYDFIICGGICFR